MATRQIRRWTLYSVMDRFGADSHQARLVVESARSKVERHDLESIQAARVRQENNPSIAREAVR